MKKAAEKEAAKSKAVEKEAAESKAAVKEAVKSKATKKEAAKSKAAEKEAANSKGTEKRPRLLKKSVEAPTIKKPRMEAARSYLKFIFSVSTVQDTSIRAEPLSVITPEDSIRDAAKEAVPRAHEDEGALKLRDEDEA